MVSLALLGLPKSWHSFHDVVNGRGKLPYWERLWSYVMEEEIRRDTRYGVLASVDEEENFILATKWKQTK